MSQVRLVLAVAVVVTLAGCATRQANPGAPEGSAAAASGQPPGESLETFVSKVRDLASNARPAGTPTATIEGHDPRLIAALAVATAQPGPESYRAVAREYARLRILDRAHDYLSRALAYNRRDWATYDALARVWRDSGSPGLALGDAHRAAYFAPDSPVARNTLGTVLQAMGRRGEAREQYEIALRLDPAASYALNNLCYGWILEGDGAKAARACEQALSAAPALVAAQNNLGILYAAEGDFDRARWAFEQTGDSATVLYNLGVVRLARREYREATEAFEAAQRVRPTNMTAARVRQATALARAGEVE